jgi:hypothetical protein
MLQLRDWEWQLVIDEMYEMVTVKKRAEGNFALAGRRADLPFLFPP